MANSDKDIRIVTNRNKSALPNISFTGYNNDPIVLNVLDDNTISFEGSSGQLFSVSNAVTTGTIFSVNDISGIPSFRIDADGTVGIAEFSGNVGIGLQSPQSKLSVGGDINASIGFSYRINGTMVLNSSSLGTGVTLSSLTSVGTISSGTWQGSSIGVLYGGTGATNASDARSFLGAATAGTNSDLTRLLGVQHLFVTIPTASAIGITVKAATSQSANMMEFVNSSNSRLAFITKDGTLVSGGYVAHSDGRIPGVSVNGNSAPGIVVRGSNSDNNAAYEVQNNPGSLTVGLYPSGLVYGGVLQAYSSTASTNATTGALIVAGGAGIANTVNIGRDLRVFSSLASSSPFTGALVVSGGVGISNNLFVGGGVAFTASIASTSSSTGTLVVTGGVGIGGTLFSSSSFANSLSGVVLNNGSISLTGTYTQSNSSTTAFSVKDGSNTTAFNIDTIGDVISLPVAVASTSTGSGSLVVAGGVGIGGTLNVNTANIVSDFNHTPNNITIGGASGWVASTASTFISPGTFRYLNNKYIGIGGTYIYYSDDMLNWSSVMVPNLDPARSIADIIYAEGKYVFVQNYTANAGYSTNLTNWTNVAISYNNWFTLAYGNGTFVVTSGGSPYAVSSNGIDWVNNASATHGYNTDIKFLNGYFYSSSSGSLERSTDGITWQTCNTPAIPYGLAYGNGLYVGGVYASGTIVYSYDGLNFLSYTGSSLVHKRPYFFNGVYYITTQNNVIIRYSTDGFNWSNSTGFPGNVDNMVYAQGKLYAASGSTVWVTNATPGRFEVNPLRTGTLDSVEIGRLSPNNANFIDVSVNNNLNVSSQYSSTSPLNGALTVAGGVGIGGSLYVSSATAISGVTINAGVITGSLTGTASTATYSHQSGYGISSGTATTATYAHQSGYATTSQNINVVSATTNASHPVLFTPTIGSASGAAVSTESTFVYNPSTDILSISGLAVTSGAASASTTSGALIVTGGAGIGQSLFTSSSYASSISGVVFNNGAITNTGTITSTGVMTLSNSSTTAFAVRDGSNNPTFTIDTIGDIVSLPVAVASTSTGSGSLVVAGGVGIGGTLNVGSANFVENLLSFGGNGTTGGLSWVQATVPTNFTEPFNKVVFGNGLFAAIGVTAAITSTDGVSWTIRNIPWPVTPNGMSLFYLNDKFVVNSVNSGYVAYSNNGISWQTSLAPVTSGNMVYNGGLYYKYSGSTVGISTNLANWTTQTTNGSAYRVLNGYFYSSNQRSIDGINFESLVFPGTAPVDINYGNGIYFGAVYNSSIYYTSTDGINFIQGAIESNVYLGAEYYNGVYYLRCQHNIPKLYYSQDGYNYASVNLFSNQYNLSMAFGNNKIVYVGYNPSQVNFIAYSTATSGVLDINTKFEGSLDNVVIGRKNARSASFLDVGVSGRIVSNNTFSSTTISNNSAVFAGGVGIGQTLTVGGSVNVSNSFNLVNTTTGIATTWTRTVVGTGATITYLAYANNLYVGVGYSSITSTDGVNWTTRTLPHNLSYVTFGNGIWSGLLYGSALGATSTNGTSWTSYAMTNSRNWTMMAFGNGVFVTIARYTDIAAYSTNGYNWTEVTLPTTGSPTWVWITFGGGYFLAIANASTTAIYSTDGINWTTTTLPSAAGWNTVTYGNGYFYVTGSSRFGVYSKDLINWTSYSTTIDGGAYVAYNNGAFVVADYTGVPRTNIITGDFSSRIQIDLPGPQIPTALVAGDRNFIAGFGQTLYTFPIPNNSISVYPNTTGEINNVEIGSVKPASGNFTNIFSQGLVAIGSTARSVSPYTGALVVRGGVGIGGSLYVSSATAISGVTINAGVITGSLTGLATTSTYSLQSGYAITSGLATTSTYSHQSGYATTSGSSGLATTATYAHQSGYAITSGFATTSTYSYQSGYATTSGFATSSTSASIATTSYNVNVNAASANSSHYLIFSPNVTGSGVALSTESALVYNPSTDILSVSGLAVTSSLGSTSTSTGALTVSGGVGIGGTLNILGNATIGGTLNVSGSNSYFQNNLYVGNNTQGRLFFSQATLGSAGTTVIPSMAFIGATNSPITLSVLPDNSLSFDGSSGQLFSINNNLSTGWIFSINDISGLPIFRTNADLNVAMGEYGGNVGIGLSNAVFKLQVVGNAGISGTTLISNTTSSTNTTSGALVVSGGVGIGGSLFVSSPSSISSVTINAGVVTGNLTGIATTATYSNQSGYAITSGFATSSTSASIANTAYSVNANSASTNASHFLIFSPSASGSGVALSTESALIYNPSTDILSVSGLAVTSSLGSTSTSTGALIITGGVGIGQSLFTSTSYASSISGAIFSNGSATLPGTFTQNNSSTTAFQVRDGSNNPAFIIDTIGDVISLPVAVASTSTGSGSLVVAGGVGIGGTLNARSVYIDNDLMHTPGVGNTFTNSWTSITFPSGFSASRIIYAENKFVAIGGSVVVYSSDLINWTTSYIPWPSALSCQAITYGNGYYAIMPSQSAYVAYSSDLLNWGIGSVTYQNYGSITYGNGRFLANSGAVVGISTNGTNWGSFTPNGNIGGGILSYHNGYFYTPTARSVDGINWESLNIPITVTNIQYGNGLYFGAQYNSSNYTYSTDGLNFTSATIENNVYVGADYHNGVYYLRTQHNVARLYYSFDGKNYQYVNTPGGINIYGMAFGKNKIAIVGFTGAGAPYSYYAEGTNGKIDLNPIREGNIDNTVIGRRTPKPANFTDVSSTGYVNIVNQAASASTTSGALVVRGGVGIGGSLFVSSPSSISSVTINAGVVTGNLTGTATTATYSNQSGYAITSGFATSSTSASIANNAYSVNANSASSNASHFLIFSPSASGSGVALSTESALVYNPSTDILSVSGLAVTSSLGSTSSSTGALIVTGGVGIGGTLFSSSSFANSLSGVVLNNGSVSLSGTFTQSNSSTTAFQVRDGSNNPAFVIDTIGDVISLPVAVASTSTGSGSLVVAGGVGIGGTLNVGSVNVINNINYYPATGATGGIAWSTISLPAGVSGITKMIYANNKFVGVGNTFAVYSNDGLNWSSVNFTGFSSSENFNNLAFGNGKYVALAGSAATVALYSTDAITWTRSFLPASRVVFRGLAYGNGYFVGIEQSNIPVRSTDGINWTSASGLAGYIRNVKFINGLFIATLWLATNEDYTYTSTDGVDWTRLSIPLVNSYGITYGNGKYLASSIGTTSPIVSTDLVNWTRLVKPAPYYDQLYDPSYHNGTFYIPNNFSQILYSNDLVNWSYVSAVNNEVVYGADKLILANGTSVLVSQSAQGKADISPFLNSSIENTRIGAKSPDSATFTHLSALNNVSFTSPLNSTSVNNGSLVVNGGVGIGQSVNIGGKLDVSNTINYTATNSGIANTWTRITIPSPVSISGLTYGNGLYVGVGYSAATSTDGITWTARTLPHNLTTVKYGNNLYVGVNYGSALGATSTDGITWRSMSLPSSANWDGIAYGNGIYVITATYNNNLVAYSYNGFQWTLGSLPIPGGLGFFVTTPVIFGGGYFYTGGYSGAYYFTSVDGINWTLRTGLNAVATNNSCYGDGTWLLTGSSASLAYTKDLTNWTYGGHYGYSGQSNVAAYTNGTFAIVDFGSLQGTLIYKNLSTVVATTLPGPSYASTITAGEGKFVAGAGSTVYVTDIATHTFNIFPNNSGELNNVRIGAKFPSSAQFTVLSTSGLASVGSSAGSASTTTGALVVKGGVGIGGSLFVGNTLSVGSSTASTSATSGALIVSGGVGIGGSVYTDSSISVGTLNAPSTGGPVSFALAGLASTGNLLASTTYYYKISAIDYTGGESLPSNESSVTLTGSQNAVRVTTFAQPGVLGYRIYRTASSGIYTTSFIATTYPSNAIANINQALTYYFYDYGITASAIAPLSTSTFRPVSINRSTFSNFGNVNIHRGNLVVNTPNYSTFTNEAIEVGNGNQIFVKDHTSFYLGSLTASTGGTLTDGTTYYYKFSAVDFYNNETFTGREFSATAGTGGAITLNFAGEDQNVAALRIYRSTTPGNFTNSYLGQFSTSFKDINYPTSNTSPPTVSSARALYLSSRYDQESFIPNIKVTPGGNSGNFIKTLGGSPDPTVTTSGTAGSLIPGTTYYYKAVVLDIFGNYAFQSDAVSVGIGTFTSTNVGVSGVDWPYGYARFLVFRSTNRNNFSNSTYYILNPGQTYNDVGDAGYTGTPSSSDSYKIAQIGVANYGFPSNYLRNLVLGTGGNSDQLTAVNGTTGLPTLQAATGGTLVNGQTYYYRVESQDVFNYSAFSSPPVKIVADSGGAVRITFSGTSSQNMLNKWSVFRSTSLTNWSNSLLQYHIAGTAFTDYGWATIGGSPNDSSDRSVSFKLNSGRMTLADIRTQGFFIRQDAVYNITSTPGIGGSLSNNSTYYYRIAPISWGNYQSTGQLSDEIVVSTGSTQNSITLSWNSSYGACAYDVYRTTTRGNYSNVPYYTVTNTSFVDNGQTTLTKSASFDVFYPGSQKEMIHSYYGNNLSHLTIAGESSFLKYAMRAPRELSATTGSGGTLPNNTTYFYVVEAYDYGNNRTLASNPVQIDTGANNAVTLSWNEVLGASYYKIYRNASLGSFTNSLINVVIKSNSFTDINYPVSNTSPQTNPNYAGSTLFVNSYNNNYSLFAPRTIIQGVPSSQAIYATDFLLRLAAYPARSIYGSLLELGDYSNDGYNGSSDGTYLGIASSTGFSGDYVNFQASSVSRFKINNLGNTTIGSTTGSGSTSTGALVVSGGVGIGQSLFTSTAYTSSISGAIFSNGSATLSGAFIQNNTSTTAFQVRDASSSTVLSIDTLNDIVSLPIAIASTTTGTGSLVVAGGVGIGGSVNVGGRVGIGTNLLTAALNITTPSASNSGIVIQGSTSQSASLFRVNSSIGGSFFEITNSGIVNIKTSTAGDYNSVPLQRWYGDSNSIVGVMQKGGFFYTGNGLGYVDGAGTQTLIHQWIPASSYYITNWSKRMSSGASVMFESPSGGDVRISGDSNGSLTFQSYGTYTNNTMVKLKDPNYGTNQALLGIVTQDGSYTRSQLFSYGNLSLNMTVAGSAGTDWDTTNLFRANVYTKTKYLGNLAVLAVDDTNRFVVGPYGNTTVALGGTTVSTGLIIKGASSQTGNLFEVQSSTGSTLTYIDSTGDVYIGSSVASTNTSTGALVVSGGVGISGQLSFSRASFGFTGITTNPTMSFIGATSSAPITLSVLTDNSLSWEGSSGQLFSIDNNLSSGEIFSVSDISGLPIISASSGQTVTINEFGGFTRVGNGSINSSSTSTGSLQVAGGVGISGNAFIGGTVSITNTTNSTSTTSGALIVSGGVGIGGSLYVASATAISGVTINSGVITGSLTGTATTATYANQSGYAITSGSSNTSGYATTSGFATTSTNINVVSATTSASHPVLFTPATGTASGAALSTESTFVYNPNTDILSVSGLAITSGTASTNPTTGALVVTGGVGISGSLFVGSSFDSAYLDNGWVQAAIAGSSLDGGVFTLIKNTATGTSALGYAGLLIENDGAIGVISLGSTSINGGRFAIESGGELYLTSVQPLNISSDDFISIISQTDNYYDAVNHQFSGGPVQITASIASTSTTSGDLIVAGGVGIAKTSYFGQSVFIQGTTASGSTTTGALTVTGGVGIGGSLFTSSSNASSISGVILNNGAITNTGTITSTGVMTLSNSSATAFQVRDGSNNARLSVDTIGGVVSVSSSTASTNTLTGALVVGGGLGVSGDVFLASLPNSKLSVMNSFGDEGGEIFLNKPSTNTTITNGVTIDIYQNRLRFFEQGGSARGFYLDITAGGNSAGTNLVGGGSGTVTSLTAGTGISFSTGATITTTGTIRARRPLVTSFCAGYTPAASGADSVVIRLPDSPSDGTTAITYKPQEFHIRVETASATTTTIQLEKYTGTGAFSGTAITSVSISGGSTYEAQTSVFAGAGIFLTSGDKLRINFTALSASHANFSVYLELEEV